MRMDSFTLGLLLILGDRLFLTLEGVIFRWHKLNSFAEIKVAKHFTFDDKEKYPLPKGKKLKDMFEIGAILGQGAFSKVYFAESKDKSDKNQYALKSINKLKVMCGSLVHIF